MKSSAAIGRIAVNPKANRGGRLPGGRRTAGE